MAKRSFGQRLQELGYKEARSGMARKRRGIRLKNLDELLEELSADLAPAHVDDANAYVLHRFRY